MTLGVSISCVGVSKQNFKDSDYFVYDLFQKKEMFAMSVVCDVTFRVLWIPQEGPQSST